MPEEEKSRSSFNYYKTDEGTCRCYMQVTMVENAPVGLLWDWYDLTDGNYKGGYRIYAMGNFWNNKGDWLMFPTTFQELDYSPGSTSSAGVHIFEIRPLAPGFPPDFRLHTKTKCYWESNGNQQLLNTYNKVYELGQGDLPLDQQNNPYGASFISSYSCYTSPGGGSE